MGIFSSKKVTTVDTSVVRVIPNDQLPNSLNAGLNTAIFKDTPIAEEVIEAVIQGVAIKANRYYKYGRDKYAYGLPSGKYRTSVDGDNEISAILTRLENRSIAIAYIELSQANYYHMAWDILFKNYDYVESTNEIRVLSQQKSTTVFLDDIEIVISDITDFEQEQVEVYGLAGTAGATPLRGKDFSRLISPFTLNTDVINPILNIKYIYVISGDIYKETLSIPFPIYGTENYFHVKYTLPDAPQSTGAFGQPIGAAPNPADDPVKYWTYKDNSGTYPELDNIYNAPAVSGLFFPFIYFRYGKRPEVTSGTSNSYVTSKKLVNIIDMDFDKVTKAINKSPDIKDVEQAMMILAVPANSQNKIEKQYLFDFFTRVYGADTNSILRGGSIDVNGGLIIQDRRFKMVLSSAGITKNVVNIPGKVGKLYVAIGSVTKTAVEKGSTIFPYRPVSSGHYNNSYNTFGISIVTTTIHRPVSIGGGVIQTVTEVANKSAFRTVPGIDLGNGTLTNLVHFYQKQLTPTTREEIMVHDLRMIYFVTHKYFVTANGGEPILLIPIDYSISNQYSLVDREELYARSLHYVFNTKVVTKVKWYQSSFFSALLKFAGIVAFVYSLGASSAISSALIGAGFTASQTVILGLIINAAISLVVSAVLKVVVKAVGLELGIILGAIAAYYGGNYLKSFNINTTFSENFLSIVNGLIGAKQSLLAEQMAGLSKEFDDFNLLKTDQDKELERANKLLESTNRLNPFIIIGETPTDYYNRSSHSGNIGVLSLDAISSFVEISLKLPTIDNTLGEEFHAYTI